ncbi:MAG: UvrD-helicase domain-containing protein [Deltaproteobacteria bacterium]|nr:UvrD-helicase domain-containing protein [Deltaproteobacteria bacterium]
MTALKFTPAQREAILQLDVPLCLLAGAGSGKTTVLVHHYLQLVFQKKISPAQILAVTFTDKAASDLKQRVLKSLHEIEKETVLQNSESEIFQLYAQLTLEELQQAKQELLRAPILTLHGLASKILRETLSLERGLDFEILEQSDALLLQQEGIQEVLEKKLLDQNQELKLLIEAYSWKVLRRQLLGMLKDWPKWKGQESDPWPMDPDIAPEIPKALEFIFNLCLQNYTQLKKQKKALDFNDLEEECHQLLENKPKIAAHYQGFFKALLIDEFQDTSFTQERFLKDLLQWETREESFTAPHLLIVGDPKQSIYNFRGAQASVFERFRQWIENSGGKTLFLSHNFRSPPALVHWVNTLSQELFPQEPPLIAARVAAAEACLEVIEQAAAEEKESASQKREREARLLAERVLALFAKGEKAASIFVLFRSKTPMKIYWDVFREKGIPVFVKGVSSLLECQEILDCLQVFKAYCEAENPIPWLGILRSPFIAKSDEEILNLAWEKTNEKFWMKEAFCQKIKALAPGLKASELLKWIFEESQIVSLYQQDSFSQSRAQNLLQFLHWIQNFEEKSPCSCAEFLKNIRQMQKEHIEIAPLSDQLGAQESLCFMTIHQSKGLDLPIVLLPSLDNRMNSDQVPIAQRQDDNIGFKIPKTSLGLQYKTEASALLKEISEQKKKENEVEENRIFYVAATRTEKKLILGFLPEEKTNEKLEFKKLLKKSLLSRDPPRLSSRTELCEVRDPVGLSIAPTGSLASLEMTKQVFHPFKTQKLLGKKTFSVTELECFLLSPEEYHSRYILLLPPLNLDVEAFDRRNTSVSKLDALTLGTLLHQSLEFLSKDLHQASEEILKLVWQKNLLEPLDHPESFQENLKLLKEARKEETLSQILNSKPAYSEIPFLLQVSTYFLRGSIDRLYFLDSKWQIVDYKTHLASFSPQQASEIASQYRFQLLSYCLAASKMLNKIVLHASIYFIRSGRSVLFDFSEEEAKTHEQFLIDLMGRVNQRFYN